MSQTLALLLDAYRDLNSRRMFWIVLVLSGMVAASFAAVGLTPTGFEIFAWKIPSYFLNSQVVSPGEFYKTAFLTWGIDFWLSSIASMLALISTAGLFPDFIATGAIDLYLSKPIGRWRLFFTKYLCGLLFVALQIACFCAASLLVIGLRGGAWEPGIFLAVPMVVLFFSYLFSFCVFIGVWTRSTVAAVLLTLVFWGGVWCMHKTETTLLMFQLADHAGAVRVDHEIAVTKTDIDRAEIRSATRPTTRTSLDLATYRAQLAEEQHRREKFHGAFDAWHDAFYGVMTLLPKTAETVELLHRDLIRSARLQGVDTGDDNSRQNQFDLNGNPVPLAEYAAELNHRTIGWIIGTSVAFEVTMLLLAGWVFARRDY